MDGKVIDGVKCVLLHHFIPVACPAQTASALVVPLLFVPVPLKWLLSAFQLQQAVHSSLSIRHSTSRFPLPSVKHSIVVFPDVHVF